MSDAREWSLFMVLRMCMESMTSGLALKGRGETAVAKVTALMNKEWKVVSFGY